MSCFSRHPATMCAFSYDCVSTIFCNFFYHRSSFCPNFYVYCGYVSFAIFFLYHIGTLETIFDSYLTYIKMYTSSFLFEHLHSDLVIHFSSGNIVKLRSEMNSRFNYGLASADVNRTGAILSIRKFDSPTNYFSAFHYTVGFLLAVLHGRLDRIKGETPLRVATFAFHGPSWITNFYSSLLKL